MSGGDGEFQADRIRSGVDDAALWRRFRGTSGEDVKANSFQRLKLSSARASSFQHHIVDLLPPDLLRGDALIRDIWRIGMERLILSPCEAPWVAPAPSRHFADRLHRFAWAPDLMAHGAEGAERMRTFVDSWIESYGEFDAFAWRTDPLAARLWHWLRCGPGLFDHGPEALQRIRSESFLRQVRFLEATLHSASDHKARWTGAVVLAAVSICLEHGLQLPAALSRLEGEVTAQILPDGGHVSRSPSRLLTACVHLLTLRELIDRAGYGRPEWMDKWLPRMGAMLAFFQTEDGALNVFNDGDESRDDVVNAVLAQFETPPRRFTFAPKSGFQKLEKSGLRLVLDCGPAPERPFSDWAHAGALGFELSDGPARLVTSCGYSSEVNLDWQAAVRRSGAHSTLVLAGRDSSQFVLNDETRLLAATGPEGISAKRLEEGDEIWLDAQHGGYKAACGLLHRRRLFMSGDGSRLTGEDSLVRPISQAPSEDRKFIGFEIRFHLHPTVTAMMGGDVIRLICDNGTVWRFKTSHEGARLERTVYLSRGTVERPEQIVLAGFADPNSDGLEPPNCIRWAFLKESAT